jgi:hypothetical protein
MPTLCAVAVLLVIPACGGAIDESASAPNESSGDPTASGNTNHPPPPPTPGQLSLVDASGAPVPDASPPPSSPPDAPPAPAGPRHSRCGWIGPGDAGGVQAFVANASFFDVVHPAWYYIASDGISATAYVGADDAQVLASARGNNVRIWPLIAGVDNFAYVRTMLGSASTRAAHIEVLVNLAVQHGYVGLDIDYEGLWTPSDRAPYAAFIQALTQAMHAAGKEVSIATPAIVSANEVDNAYDYVALSASLDALHIMGYDYHGVGASHPGPIAPLGWVDAACAYAASTGNGAKFILGVPNYGGAPSIYCSGTDCAAACGGSFDPVDTHMASCPYGVWAAGRAPHCPYSGTTLYFDDLGSLEEKVQVARNRGLGGVTYWNIGREHPGFFQMVQRYF